MPIRTQHNGPDYELVISGRLDGALANELEEKLISVIKEGATRVAVNMAEVNFLCSAGIRALLQYARQMKNSGKSLVVASPSPEVLSVLETTGFAEMILERPESR